MTTASEDPKLTPIGEESADSDIVIRARVLILAIPDALDTAIAVSHDDHAELRFISTNGSVAGTPDYTQCRETDLVDTARSLAEYYRPTHLIVRDGLGDHAELERCRLFLKAAIDGGAESIRSVIQTHVSPQTELTTAYDDWLKSESDVRPLRSLNVVWHDPLVETFVDCRGKTQCTEHEYGWRLATTPARLIDRRLRDTRSHNLEYITARKP